MTALSIQTNIQKKSKGFNMRKIEEEMVEAVLYQQNWKKDNTKVIYFPETDISKVYLYEKHIGSYDHQTKLFEPNVSTLLAWPTVTTRSRLSALGVSIYQKNHCQYIDDIKITEHTIPEKHDILSPI